MELRHLKLGDFELRTDTTAGDSALRFVGHPILFDTRTAIGNPLTWGFYEEIAPRAATKTLKEGDQRFLVDHLSEQVVARVSAGTLRLSTDTTGVLAEATLNTRKSYVADLVENLRDGSITGMSFGFRAIKDEWSTETIETSDGHTADVEVRRITEMQVFEVSAVTFPAYEQTDAGLRGDQIGQVRAALKQRGDLAAIERRSKLLPAAFDDLRTQPPEGTGSEPPTGTPQEPPGPPLALMRAVLDLAAKRP